MVLKKNLEIVSEGKSAIVSWFEGSDDPAIENAIRAALHLDNNAPLNLLDEEGHTIAICDAMPDGQKLIYQPASKTTLVEPKGPKPLPFIGNAFDVTSPEGTFPAIRKLVETYGSMVPMQVPGLRFFICSDADVLQDMLQRPEDFQKTLPPSNMDLGNLRAYSVGDALFTAADSEEIWQVAHRILLPGFGVQAIKQYYDRMVEVADELIAHFDKMAPEEPILVTDWMTRMTFEAIAYAGFSTRFHCMDSEEQPPFVKAMFTVLADAMEASQRFLPESFYFFAKQKRQQADALMQETVDAIIRERKAKILRAEEVPHDLLHLMLTGKDRVTGKMLPDENIRFQLITFLVAGHETTSSLLSYAIYRLICNPEIEKKLIEEVDNVLGRDYSYQLSYADLDKLQYTQRVLKETLRLNPTAPGFFKTAMKDTIVAEKYPLHKGDMVLFFLPCMHRDARYWSGDTEQFNPDNFLPEEINKRHPDAYHPFGAGIRSCIGFQFALTEAAMVLARLYQRFRFRLRDPNYKLQHIEMITVKPKDLYVLLEKRLEEKGKFPSKEVLKKESLELPAAQGNAPPILLLYGSNMGTCQTIAQELAMQAQAKGYRPIVKELDSQVGKPWDSPFAAIITSTYNGTPPDNAAVFEKWLRNLHSSPLSSCHYAVLGVGNKQWHATFQHFPQFVNKRMEEAGAVPYFPLGVVDMDSDYDHAIEAWTKGMWSKLQQLYPPSEVSGKAEQLTALTYACEIINYAGALPDKVPNTLLDQQAQEMVLAYNGELYSKDAIRSARHIEIRLPQKMTYTAGNHLGVLPNNPVDAVELAAKLFDLRLNDMVVLKSLQDVPLTEKLPIGIPISIRDLLTAYVDLLGPVSRKELRLLAQHCPCPPEKKALEELAADKFPQEVLEKERTLLDICEQFRSVELSLELLLTARPMLKPRYYSISSSPQVMVDSCSITVGVQEHTTKTGSLHKGVCSHFLAKVLPDQSVRCFIKDTKSHFRLPQDLTRDLILIGPGTGLAPLRGFLQERNQQKERGEAIGRQLLFFGCRDPNQDYLYRKELEGYRDCGLLQGLFVAFSRQPGIPKCYVQDLLKLNGALVWGYVQNNAQILVCGEGKHMAPAVREAFFSIFQKEGKLSIEEAQKLFKQKQDTFQYVEDVWA